MIFLIEKKAVGDRALLTSELANKWVEEGKAKFFPSEEELAQAYNKGEIPSNTEHIMFFEPTPEEDYCVKLSKKIYNYVKALSPDYLSVDVGGYLERNEHILSRWQVNIDDHDCYPMPCYITRVSVNDEGGVIIDARNIEYDDEYEDIEVCQSTDFESVLGAVEDIYNCIDELA